MNEDILNPATENTQDNLPYKHCLNCGSELKGKFCHVCGQEATSKTPTIGAYIKEYINDTYNWDSQFLRTFWILICRPGQLTKEYLAGKFVSQVQPLKLNMFLLFVFVTMFLFFTGTEKMNNSVLALTSDETIRSGIQFEMLKDSKEYVEKMKASPRDTILLCAPILLAEQYSDIVSKLDVVEDAEGIDQDKWMAVLPRVLIEEEIVVPDSSGYYRVNSETGIGLAEIEIFNTICVKMVELLTQYFPLLALFTAPILSISLCFVQRKSRQPHIHHFIFALHYTAFMEVLMLFIYLLYLIAAPSMDLLEYIMIIGSCVYLTIAYRRVYATSTWTKAIIKALFTSFVYLFIGFMIFFAIFLVACGIIANNILIDDLQIV